MKHWQKALSDIRFLGPDIPIFNEDVRFVYRYIQRLEAERDALLEEKRSDEREYDVPGAGQAGC